MRDADDDDAALTDEDGESGVDLSRYLWREGEREAAYTATAERQRQINSDRILADACQALAAGRTSPPIPRSAPRAGTSPTQDWVNTIDHRIARSQKPLVEAVGLEMADIRRDLQAEIRKLRDEVEVLRGQLDTARRLDALEQRLDRSEDRETPRAGLRAV